MQGILPLRQPRVKNKQPFDYETTEFPKVINAPSNQSELKEKVLTLEQLKILDQVGELTKEDKNSVHSANLPGENTTTIEPIVLLIVIVVTSCLTVLTIIGLLLGS